MLVLIANCANGRVLWSQIPRGGQREPVWVCQRDNFQVLRPQAPSELDAFINTIVAHSTGIAGALQSFTQVVL